MTILETLDDWMAARLAKVVADLSIPTRSERLADGRRQLAEMEMRASRTGIGYMGKRRTAMGESDPS